MDEKLLTTHYAYTYVYCTVDTILIQKSITRILTDRDLEIEIKEL